MKCDIMILTISQESNEAYDPTCMLKLSGMWYDTLLGYDIFAIVLLENDQFSILSS